MKPKTGMDLLIAEWVGELGELDEAIKQLGEMLPAQAETGAKLIEDSHEKLRLKIIESLNSILSQTSAYQDLQLKKIKNHQDDCLNHLHDFFKNTGDSLVSIANEARQKNVELGKKEIEDEKIKAIKEMTAAINRVNGGNLIKPALIFAVVFALVFAVGTSYLTMYLAVKEIKDNFATATPSATKHH